MTNRLIDCAELTAQLLETSMAIIDKKSRKGDVMEIKKIITYTCYHFCNQKGLYFNSIITQSSSLQDIADLFCTNHENVLHHVKKVNDLCDTEPQTRNKVENIVDFISKNLYFYSESSCVVFDTPEFLMSQFIRDDDNYLSVKLKRNNNQFVIKESELIKITKTLWKKS